MIDSSESKKVLYKENVVLFTATAFLNACLAVAFCLVFGVRYAGDEPNYSIVFKLVSLGLLPQIIVNVVCNYFQIVKSLRKRAFLSWLLVIIFAALMGFFQSQDSRYPVDKVMEMKSLCRIFGLIIIPSFWVGNMATRRYRVLKANNLKPLASNK